MATWTSAYLSRICCTGGLSFGGVCSWDLLGDDLVEGLELLGAHAATDVVADVAALVKVVLDAAVTDHPGIPEGTGRWGCRQRRQSRRGRPRGRLSGPAQRSRWGR
jgi:hypothetical protein